MPDQSHGAYELAPHLEGTWGWYRNAHLPLGRRGCRLPSPGREVLVDDGLLAAVEARL